MASGQAFEAVIKPTFHVLYPELLLPSQITTQAVKWPWNQCALQILAFDCDRQNVVASPSCSRLCPHNRSPTPLIA